MSKTNEELRNRILSENGVCYPSNHFCIFDTKVVDLMMTTAREDERGKMNAIIQGRIDELRFTIDHDQFKSPYYGEMLISELKKLIP